jgi:hypothetical protein
VLSHAEKVREDFGGNESFDAGKVTIRNVFAQRFKNANACIYVGAPIGRYVTAKLDGIGM